MVIRAGRRVKMSAEGLAVFPAYEGLAGALEGYDRVGLARVRFDGMGTAINLDLSFIEEIDAPALHIRRESPSAKRNRIIVERRKIVHKAFLLVRKNPVKDRLARKLVKALAGPAPIASEIVDEAQRAIDILS